MDVERCLEIIFTALAEGDLATSREHMRYVDEWVSRGGYIPAGYATALEMWDEIEHHYYPDSW